MRSVPLHNVNEIQEALSRANLDAAVVISPRNLWCLTAYPRSRRERPGNRRSACAIAYPKAEPTLVTGRFQEEISLIRAWVRDVTTYSDYVESPLARAAEVLRRRGLASERIGIESRFLTVEFYEDLINGLEGAEIVPCDDLLDAVWAVKQPAEIEIMKENLEKLSEAVLAALEQSQAGETEDIVHKRILATIRQDGIASVWGRLASGERVSLPNALAGKRVLGHGDLVRMDYSCTFRTYPARVCRMGVVGGPSEAQSATYERYLQAMQSAVARIGPDQSGGEIFSSARAALKEMGFQPVGSSVGYALGIAFEERPRLQAQEDFRTRAGMILCVEPQTAEGHRISQEVEITEDGSAILPSLFPLERLWILGN